MFVKTVFKSSFCLAYVLFVTTSAVHHVDEIFLVAVNVMGDRSGLPSSGKCVVGTPVSDVVASNTVVTASERSLGKVGLCDST